MRHRVGSLLVGVMLILAGTAVAAEAQAEDYHALPGLSTQDRVVLATTMIQQGQCKKGLVEVREAMKTMPENETLIRLKGTCEAQLKKPEARDTITQWLKMAPPEHPDRAKMLGLLAMSQVSVESTLDWVLVPAGEFEMGAEGEAAEPDESPKHRVFLNAFYIAKYEVSNLQYHAFVEATDYRLPENCCDSKYTLWRGNTMLDGVGELPMINVSWDDAVAFCQWSSGRLPTEAEWEKAARGTDGRIYPWGNDPVTRDRANYTPLSAKFWEGPSTLDQVSQGEFGRSPYGVYHMAGNVWEWVQDRYDESYYKKSPPQNPPGPSEGAARVIRGGSWRNTPDTLRAANRNKHAPTERRVYLGVRCAKDAKDVKDTR